MPAAQSAVQKQANVRFHLHPRHRSAGQSGGPNFIIIHYFTFIVYIMIYKKDDKSFFVIFFSILIIIFNKLSI